MHLFIVIKVSFTENNPAHRSRALTYSFTRSSVSTQFRRQYQHKYISNINTVLYTFPFDKMWKLYEVDCQGLDVLYH